MRSLHSHLPVIAFDLMDTLVRDPFREALEAATGRPLEDLFRLRDRAAYPAFERGEITEEDYWRAYATADIAVDPAAFHRTRRAGYAWLDGMRELLDELAGRVHRVVASNYPLWIEELAADWLGGRVDAVYASCHFGVRKPAPEFYRRLVAAVGVRPDQILFVDDRQDNVDGAVAAGLAAVRFDGVASVRAAIDAWGEAATATG
jgi:HAD superfamily hydrolase (TIGR01509 family)